MGVVPACGGQVWTPLHSVHFVVAAGLSTRRGFGSGTESRPYGDGGKRRGSVEAAEGVLQTLEAGLAAQELHGLEEGRGGRATGDGDT